CGGIGHFACGAAHVERQTFHLSARADEFHDEQTTLPVATRTRTCRGYTAESRGDARVRRPPDAVGRVPGLPGLDDFLRLPHRDDVVVGFQVGRNFDELYLPRTPFARRFDPRARTILVVRIEVLRIVQPSRALYEPERARSLRREGGDLQLRGIARRSTHALARVEHDLQAVRVVHLMPKFVDPRAIRFDEQKHG